MIRRSTWRGTTSWLRSACPGAEPFHNEYTKAEIREMFERVGLEPLDVHYSFPRFPVVFTARKP